MDKDLSLSISQFNGAREKMGAAAPDSTRTSLPGMELLLSRLPIPSFNIIILSEPMASAATLEKPAKEACAASSPHGVTWLLLVA